MADKRVRYYTGQFLQEQDFTTEQGYHLDRLRRHTRQLHTPGIADGLTVTATSSSTITISPGTAVDGQGRQLVLADPVTLGLGPSLANRTVYVVISYREQESDPATLGDTGNTRWSERPDIAVVSTSSAPAADAAIRLAQITVNASGGLGSLDTSIRVQAGVRLGSEASTQTLRISRQGVDPSLWPTVTSGAVSRLDLQGNLAVSGDITLGSSNASLSGHLNSRSNPHQVTAAQVGAPTSLLNVSNPGGNISLVGSGGISVSGDNGPAKQITISTSPQAIGALPATDYAFGQRALRSVDFNLTTNPSTATVDLPFRPRFLWATASAVSSTLAAPYGVGGTTNGFADLNGAAPFVQAASGPLITYYTGSSFLVINSATSTDTGIAIFTVRSTDNVLTPPRESIVEIRVSSVSATGLVLTVVRNPATNPLNANYFLTVRLLCAG